MDELAKEGGDRRAMRESLWNKRKATNPVQPIHDRCGCKVSWATYENEADAIDCAVFATVEAVFSAQDGYDFGYQSPGSITKTESGWEVCLP